MRAIETTAAFGRVERLEQASFTPQMEDSQSAARASPPACLGFGYLANSLAQLLRQRDVSSSVIVRWRKHRWSPHQISCKLRWSATRALAAPPGAGWRRGRCCACAPLSIAIYTAPFTFGISAQLRSVAQRTSVENSNSPLASRRMPTW